ncbi:NAD(P)-dependent oxidoreductase [Clostridium sp. WILCCON 0269]|uniref:precorrin-2 dehydrogenase n=1 Tax=Candidatus Clostridium eludens TaxID=3381663 RepID=A0ABW8SP85_9CLOT
MKRNISENNSPMLLSLLSCKIKVIVIGGGNAAYIKSKTFALKGCQVYILAEKFIYNFENIKDYLNVTLIKGRYDKRYIEDKHIVVIATDKEEVNSTIQSHCMELCKIYVDTTNSKNGNSIIPCQRNSKNVSVGVNIKGVSPITSVFIADKIIGYIKKYDNFVEFSSKMRNAISHIEYKKSIMSFICTDDFYFFYEKGKACTIIKMFYKNEFE